MEMEMEMEMDCQSVLRKYSIHKNDYELKSVEQHTRDMVVRRRVR